MENKGKRKWKKQKISWKIFPHFPYKTKENEKKNISLIVSKVFATQEIFQDFISMRNRAK